MQYKYYITDVFTDIPFGGAQIAVFPNADGLDTKQMQLIAAELNLSETVFIFNSDKQDISRKLRIFSPTKEIDFAGHPIIATGFILASTGEIELTGDHTDIIIEQNIGPIDVNISHKSGQVELIQFRIKPNAIVDRYVPTESQLAEMLGIEEPEIEKLKYHTLLVSTEQTYLIIPVRSFDAVRKSTFNYTSWSQSIAPICMAKEILLFSKQSDNPSSTFHARLVGPDIGINEDPPIASAMPALTAYFAAHDTINSGIHTFVIDRGTTKTRKSILSIEMEINLNNVNQLRVGGPAVLTGEGNITIPD